MHRILVAAVCGLALLSGTGRAQSGLPDYLEIYKVRVNHGKMSEYQAAARKMADMNRKNGDRWIALSTEYGDNTGMLQFSSTRQTLADVEAGFGVFEKAGKEAMGPAGWVKFLGEVSSMEGWQRSELRRRRWDLSVALPKDRDSMLKTVAGTRWIRTVRIELKPGKMSEFIEAWKPWQETLAKLDTPLPTWVSTSMTGPAAVYAAIYYKSLADMDSAEKNMPPAFQSDGYRTFVRTLGDIAVRSEWDLMRVRPELSCPPEELIAADPAFWAPKAMPNMSTATRVKKPSAAEKKDAAMTDKK